MSVAPALKPLKGKSVPHRGAKIAKKVKAKVIELPLRKNQKQDLSETLKEEYVIKYRLKARKLARSILRKWHSRLDIAEVDSLVDLSLCEAVQRYNPSKGASFMTFLFYHLRGNLIRAISLAVSANAVPVTDIEALIALEEGGDSSRNGAPFKGVSAIEVAEALSSRDHSMPDELLFKKEMLGLSQKASNKLDNLEREVLERIYMKEEQLIDVANSLGYSRCHISRVKRKALETLYDDIAGSMKGDVPGTRPRFDDEEEQGYFVARRPADRRKVNRRRPRSKQKEAANI